MLTSKLRVGNGVDVHPLVKGKKLILGGVHIEHDFGCDGHSDGDVLVHSIIDAILGAIGKGDIGAYFPSSDEQYKNANSLNLLNERHVKKIFNRFKFKHLVHLAVTRNPYHIKTIRNYNTVEKDTLMMFNLLKYCNKLKSITFTSSGSIYAIKEVDDFSKREIIAKKINNFISNSKKNKFKIETISNKKRKNLHINPLYHKNSNKRLNGSNKFINELILSSFCFENKISLYILRPSYVIETKDEKNKLKNKIKAAQKR